ncbi:hypothetical protein GWL_23940 [Herbaspirillum sp. GW103]|jgi:hypothetical protein|uniref:cytochrome oxidase putative small subunit CydP n=1 Tax=unclassified Herbaspirillum TaxID=2624150 RepID=UPI00025E2EF1|nr:MULTISPECIES: cytochrome oxidase putative small subunit CydP [unclassified Herbaspirillum]EIJ48152.1 hypothetical protein GWL_23940 [Herbaspirillum sp. GW103]MCI1005567.1 hypothetical protein [Herbaspirillum sp. C7C8]
MQLTQSRKRPWRWPRLTQLPLGVEITLLLVVKIALITVLARTFFAHPEAKHMQMPVQRVEQRMLSFTAPPASTEQIQDLSAKQQTE